MGPIQALLRSRKFLLLCLDTVISVVLALVAEFVAPEAAKTIQFLIAALQPVFVAIIVAISVEDAAFKRAGGKFPY